MCNTPPPRPALAWLGMMAGGFCAVSPAYAGMQLARGELSFRATVQEEYDTNIFGNSFELGDWHNQLIPELTFVRDAGIIRLATEVGAKVQRFRKYSKENSVDPFGQLRLNWKQDDTKTYGSFESSYRRRSEANPDVNTRTQSDDVNITAWFAHFPVEKAGYRLLTNFADSDFESPAYLDTRSKLVGAEGRYKYSEKLEGLLGIDGRWNAATFIPVGFTRIDSSDVKLRVGLEGEILPKLTGRLIAGWVGRSLDLEEGGHQSALLFDTSLVWRPDEETSVSVIVTRDFDTAPLDQSVMRLIITLEATRQLHEKLSLSAGITHLASKYIGNMIDGRDLSYLARFAADYHLTQTVNARASVSYTNTDSNRVLSSYDRFVGGIALVAGF